MAATILRRIHTSNGYCSLRRITGSFGSRSDQLVNVNSYTYSFQVRSIATAVGAVAKFESMIATNERKYYMLGGKGGVGKTSCAASLAVRFANHGHPTIVVSTDPAHSLSDSFDQNLTGGALVHVQGTESPLYALEINPEKAKEELMSAAQRQGGIKNMMDGMGLGALAEQLEELKIGELLDNPPPGMDEAIAISKVMNILELPEYSTFTRIILDTAPTGHTLRLLALPDFMDASIGKMMKLKKTISSAKNAFKSMFGKEDAQPKLDTSDKLEQLRAKMKEVHKLFHNPETTEFIIVTIPTVMAVSESSRLCGSLKKDNVPVQRIIVNQVLPQSSSNCNFCSMKRKDQLRAIDLIKNDPILSDLSMMEAPLFDLEIRGVPALKYMGDMIWR
ncbi:ATPase GET3B-like [Impatiens glandulifera]|uniref:ATPase GET3B-like n=1 Tax=Impatiens glandulifera TaxID=253017 RepID=UPI001FB053D6|nr:ATPase GET3B-like [Impatiens glandulifera]